MMLRVLLPMSMVMALSLPVQGQSAGTLEVLYGHQVYGNGDVPSGDFYTTVGGGHLQGLALRSDGSIAIWGQVDPSFPPLGEPPAGGGFIDIDGGRNHHVALHADGSLHHWGEWIGRPGGADDFIAVTAGNYHGAAVRADGSLAYWGGNEQGTGTPPDVQAAGVCVDVDAKFDYDLALRADGSLYSWGVFHRFDGDAIGTTIVPAFVPAGNDYVAIAAGKHFAMALRADGSIAVWGIGTWDEPAGNDYVAIDAAFNHGAALRSDGTIVVWDFLAFEGDFETVFTQKFIAPQGNSYVAVGCGAAVTYGIIGANQAPMADAGPDQSVHCEDYDGAEVLLDGSFSYDPDGDNLRYEWSVAELSGIVLEDPTAPVTAGRFPIGVHEVTLTVYDVDEYGADIGGVDSDSVIITVYDDDPPVARVTTDVETLFPADGEMMPVTIYVEASDYCSAPNDLAIFCSVSSDQPDDAGNSNRTGDVDGLDGYTLPVEVSLTNVDDGLYEAVIWLRAERVSTARTYSIGLRVEDASGNRGEASTTVVVPHDRRRN